MCHLSHVTLKKDVYYYYFLKFIFTFFGQSGGASQVRLCHQRHYAFKLEIIPNASWIKGLTIKNKSERQRKVE